MKRLLVCVLALSGCGITVGPGPMGGPYVPALPGPKASNSVGEACYFQSEQAAGMNKICYYNCIGSLQTIAHNVSSVSLCPNSINR